MTKIHIGGRERELKLGTLGISVVEEELKCSFLRNVGDLFKDLQLRTLVALTWGGLVHGDPKLQKSTVASWIDQEIEDKNIEALMTGLTEMIENCGLFKGIAPEKKATGKKSKPSE
jgi:hypothetical protein